MSVLLASKAVSIGGFDVVYNLIDYCEGWSQFSDKWERDIHGLIEGDRGDMFNCTWYSIGQLNKGNDLTVLKAQREFDRDCYASDVGLKVSVNKNDVELFDDHIIGADYHSSDCTECELLEMLLSDYAEQDEYISQAKNKLQELLK